MFVQIRDSAGSYQGTSTSDCDIASIIDRFTKELNARNLEIRIMLVGGEISREAMDILRG